MTTLPTTHRPTSLIAAAAVAAAVAAGALAASLAHSSGQPGPPPEQSPTSVHRTTPTVGHFQPTTSGGRVILGE